MYSIVVLGQIPGTDITITFSMWMATATLLIAIVALARMQRHRTIANYFAPTISEQDGPITPELAQ